MSSAMASDAAPSLKFNERIPPFAILAAGKLAAVDIQLNPVSGAAKDAAPILTLPSG